MILSYDIPEWRTYQAAALDLYDVERDIETRRHSKHAVDRKIMPRLIEKRERMVRAVAPLKEAADAAERRLLEQKTAPANGMPAKQWRPAGGDDALDIPAFLRRQAC